MEEVKTQQEEEEAFQADFDEFSKAKDQERMPDPDPADPPKALADDEHSIQDPPSEKTEEPREPDPLADLSEDARKAWDAREAELANARKQLEQEQHKYASDIGRVAAYQRKFTELQTELEEARKPPADADKPSPTQSDVQNALATDESWKAFSEEYPEIASAIDNRLKPLQEMRTDLDETKRSIEPAIKTAEGVAEERAMAKVTEVHEDFHTVVRHPAFGQWLEQQPPAIRSLQDSNEPADAISLVSYFKDYAKVNMPADTAAGNPNNPSASETAQPSEADEAEKIRRAREQRLDKSQSPTPSTAGTTEAVPEDDFDMAFEVFSKQKDRASARRY